MTVNNCVFGGSITNIGDPRTEPGREFITFTILVQPSGKNKDGSEREALFIRCVAFGFSAKFAIDYMTKGQKAVVIGSLEKRRYTDRNGAEKESYQLRVQSLQLVKETALDGRKKEAASEPQEPNGNVADDEVYIPGESDMF